MDLIMTKMEWSIQTTMISMVMQIVLQMMMTEMESWMKIQMAGIPMVMECQMVGKHLMGRTLHLLRIQMELTVTLMVMV